MKNGTKKIHAAIAALFFSLCMMLPSVALAAPMEEVGGIYYWYGNENFPFWSVSAGTGAVADISSAYVELEDATMRKIGFIDFSVSFGKNDNDDNVIIGPSILSAFWVNKDSGEFFFNLNGRPSRKVEDPYTVAVFSMLRR